jgi:hypothetical protein
VKVLAARARGVVTSQTAISLNLGKERKVVGILKQEVKIIVPELSSRLLLFCGAED